MGGEGGEGGAHKSATSRVQRMKRPSAIFMMLALCTAVTFFRPLSLAYWNANSATRLLATLVMTCARRPGVGDGSWISSCTEHIIDLHVYPPHAAAFTCVLSFTSSILNAWTDRGEIWATGGAHLIMPLL